MIIVTGGAGFIGSNLVAGLGARGISDVVVCDILGTEEKWRNLAKHELRDIVRPENLIAYLDENKNAVEIIFHLGAISATTERDGDKIIETNVAPTRALWKWCARNGKRFIYASSAATYGDGTQGFRDDDAPDALASLRPLNLYGWSKHMIDRLVSRIARGEVPGESAPPQWAGLKFFNVYGPNEYHKGDMMSVVCKLVPQVQDGARAKLFRSYNSDFGDGGQIRDFVHVDDCVSVMLWLLDNPKVSGLFNVGTGKGRTFKDLATAVFTALGREPQIDYIDMPTGIISKYQYFTQAEMGKFYSAGYTRPFTELEEGVRDYVQNYLAAADPYR